MTIDNNIMAVIAVLKHPGLLVSCVRRNISTELNEMLKDINVKPNDLSLTYSVRIEMLIEVDGIFNKYIGGFEVFDSDMYLGSAIVIERCLKCIDDIVARAKK